MSIHTHVDMHINIFIERESTEAEPDRAGRGGPVKNDGKGRFSVVVGCHANEEDEDEEEEAAMAAYGQRRRM